MQEAGRGDNRFYIVQVDHELAGVDEIDQNRKNSRIDAVHLNGRPWVLQDVKRLCEGKHTRAEVIGTFYIASCAITCNIKCPNDRNYGSIASMPNKRFCI